MRKSVLKIDESKYRIEFGLPVNTLQFFITNKCNKRCKACFYAHNLGGQDMDFDLYQYMVQKYAGEIKKVILLGGEPTLCKKLPEMVYFNQCSGLRTTVYTNGANLKIFDNVNKHNLTVRIGVYGAKTSEKPLNEIPRTDLPVTIVFMLRRDNIDELPKVAKMAEEFNCNDFYISTIRDIAQTGNYWMDTEETVPFYEYFEIVKNFLATYTGKMRLHIARRGYIETDHDWLSMCDTDRCRFGNVFPDGRKIICPFDISKEIYADELSFGKRQCNKNVFCLLQKFILEPRA